MATKAKKTESPKKESPAPVVKAPEKKHADGRGLRKPKEISSENIVHVGKLINQKLMEKGVSKNRFSKMINVTAPSVTLMLKNHSIQSDRLIEISEKLKHNFFMDIAKRINVDYTTPIAEKHDDSKVQNLQGKIADMELEMRFIKEENAFLRKILELMAGGKG